MPDNALIMLTAQTSGDRGRGALWFGANFQQLYSSSNSATIDAIDIVDEIEIGASEISKVS